MLLLGSLPASTGPPALAAAAALLLSRPLRCPPPGPSRRLQLHIRQHVFAGRCLGSHLVSVRLVLQSRLGGTLLSGPPPGSHLHSRHEMGSCLGACHIAVGLLLQPRLKDTLLVGACPWGCLCTRAKGQAVPQYCCASAPGLHNCIAASGAVPVCHLHSRVRGRRPLSAQRLLIQSRLKQFCFRGPDLAATQPEQGDVE